MSNFLFFLKLYMLLGIAVLGCQPELMTKLKEIRVIDIKEEIIG